MSNNNKVTILTKTFPNGLVVHQAEMPSSGSPQGCSDEYEYVARWCTVSAPTDFWAWPPAARDAWVEQRASGGPAFVVSRVENETGAGYLEAPYGAFATRQDAESFIAKMNDGTVGFGWRIHEI